MLIDTHAHLDYPDFAGDFKDVLRRAREAGVTRIITIGTSIQSSRRAIALAEAHDSILAVVGVHPTSVMEAQDDFISPLRELAMHPRVVAIGETGLDYHRLPSSRHRPKDSLKIDAFGNETPQEIEGSIEDGACVARQAAFFEQQLDLAADLGLNVVIHQRDAWEDTLSVLRPWGGRVRGVFHCFGGTEEQAREVIEAGHLVSFTGIVTFKNGAAVRAVAGSIPADTFMVETDCPYLAPVPHRGKRCEPAHTRLTAETIAVERGCTLEELARATTATAGSFFRFHRP